MKRNELQQLHSDLHVESGLRINRREFLTKAGVGIGGVALASLFAPGSLLGQSQPEAIAQPVSQSLNSGVHFPPKIKRVIYLFPKWRACPARFV